MLLAPSTALALPNMIRLGYPHCVSCHIDPQGGGLLNEYGRGIDEAQSLRAGEYDSDAERFLDRFSWNGRIDQDGRGVGSAQLSHPPNGATTAIDRYRLSYRNVTRIWNGFRVSTILDAENEPANRPAVFYDPVNTPKKLGVRTALLQYRPKEGVEFAAGRDTLPTGLNIPDETAFIQSRNRFGYYDTPQLAKIFFWGKRWRASSYAFTNNPNEPANVREKGGGMLAEYDLFGNGRTVVGTQNLRGTEPAGSRNLFGAYTRLGFGRWGILAEHDVTRRKFETDTERVGFDQSATYGQLFVYPREWLALAAVVERLNVEAPHHERLWAYKGEFSMRFSPNWTLSGRAGVQRNALTGAHTPIASVQLALKPVS